MIWYWCLLCPKSSRYFAQIVRATWHCTNAFFLSVISSGASESFCTWSSLQFCIAPAHWFFTLSDYPTPCSMVPLVQYYLSCHLDTIHIWFFTMTWHLDSDLKLWFALNLWEKNPTIMLCLRTWWPAIMLSLWVNGMKKSVQKKHLLFESRDTELRGQRCYFGYVVVCSWTVSSTAHMLTAPLGPCNISFGFLSLTTTSKWELIVLRAVKFGRKKRYSMKCEKHLYK